MAANAAYFPEAGDMKQCACGTSWIHHCRHKDCDWRICPKCEARYDPNQGRLYLPELKPSH